MFSAKDIKNLRRALNLNQRELAEKLGVSVGTIQNYEKGGVIPESKHKILVNLTKHDPIAEKILGVITGDSSIRGNNNISNTGIMGSEDSEPFDEDKAIEFLHSQLVHVNEMVKELMEQRKEDNAILKHFMDENRKLKEENKKLIEEIAKLKKSLNL